MHMPVYDRNLSPWLNVKGMIENEAVMSVRKSNVWKEHIGEAQYAEEDSHGFESNLLSTGYYFTGSDQLNTVAYDYAKSICLSDYTDDETIKEWASPSSNTNMLTRIMHTNGAELDSFPLVFTVSDSEVYISVEFFNIKCRVISISGEGSEPEIGSNTEKIIQFHCEVEKAGQDYNLTEGSVAIFRWSTSDNVVISNSANGSKVATIDGCDKEYEVKYWINEVDYGSNSNDILSTDVPHGYFPKSVFDDLNKKYPYEVGNATQDGTTEDYSSISRIPLIDMIRDYQVLYEGNLVARDGSKIDIQDAIDMCYRVRDMVTGDAVIQNKYISPQSQFDYGTPVKQDYINMQPLKIEEQFQSKIVALASFGSIKYETSDDQVKYAASVSTTNSYYEVYTEYVDINIDPDNDPIMVEKLSKIKKTGSFIPKIPMMISWSDSAFINIDSFVTDDDSGDDENMYREYYTVVYEATKSIGKKDYGSTEGGNYVIEEQFGTYYTKNALLFLINKLTDELLLQLDIYNDGVGDAKESPAGKILFEFGSLDNILAMNISQLNRVDMTFRISNIDNMNELDDIDEATKPQMFEYFKERVPMWDSYMLTILQSHNNYFRIVGYVPNWNTLHIAPPFHMLLAMQASMTIEYNNTPPDKETNVMNIIMSVIVAVIAVVLAIPTGVQSLTWGYGLVTTILVVTTSIANIAAELTGSEKWSKFSKMLGILTSVVNIPNAMKEIGKNVVASTVEYANKIASYGVSKYRQKKLEKLAKENQSVLDDIDCVEELIATEQQEKHDRIQKFIYGEHMTEKYTNQYNYDIDYSIRYMK